MKAVRAALAALLVLTLPAHTAPARYTPPDGGGAIVVPERSPLVFRGFDAEGAALFDGRVTLSGTYYYGDGDQIGEPEVYATALFVPDAASARLLPYFDDRGDVDQIVLTNTEFFAHAVVPAKEQRRILKKGAAPASGHATIVIDRYKAAIECDGTVFSARFVAIVRPKLLSMSEMPGLGC